jgi:Fe-S-cluster containining protein
MGACCRRTDKALEVMKKIVDEQGLPAELAHFPYSYDKNGKCSMLSDDNKCRVYLNRPAMCNIETLSNHVRIAKKDFFNMNIMACNTLIVEGGLPEIFKLEQLE